MTTIITNYYDLYLKESADPRVRGWPLMDSPVPIATIVALYYYFVKYAGPKFMEKRKPFDLKKVMMFYNAGQTIVNAWAFWQGLMVSLHPQYTLTCSPISTSADPFHMKVVYLSYIYFLIKVVDLADTIFMILRKNYRQVTFLHIYHHAGMALGSWIVMNFIPGVHLAFVGVLNTFVHTIMYFYYLLTAYDQELKKSIWWKKHITELQMVQFSLIFLQQAVGLFNPYCTYPKITILVYLSQNFLMAYLFAKFYYNTYIKPNKVSKK